MTRAKIHLFLNHHDVKFIAGITTVLFIFIPFPSDKSIIELVGFATAVVVITFITIAFLWKYFVEHLAIFAPKLYKLGKVVRIDNRTGVYTIVEVYENTLSYYAKGTGKYWYKPPVKATHDEIHPLKPISRRA